MITLPKAEPTVAARSGEGVERDIRVAIWNAGMNGGMGQDLTLAFIQRAMAEPLMQRALATLAESASQPEVERAFKAGWRKCWCRDPDAPTPMDGGMQAEWEAYAALTASEGERG